MRDSFMVPEIHECTYFAIECNHGETNIVPDFACSSDRLEDFADYVNGEIDADQEIKPQTGFVYRLQAPGYLDATEWSAAATEKEALEALLDEHGSQTGTEDMESWELDARLRILEIDGLGRFECVECFNGYQVMDRITEESRGMSDGVDQFFSDDPANPAPVIGTEAFRKAWEDMLNENPDETLEAYFPDQYEREND